MKAAKVLIVANLIVVVFFAALVSLWAQSEPAAKTPEQVAYVRLIEGDVGYLRGDDDNKDNWNPATVNVPVQSGDSLYANPQGRAEVQLGQDGLVRLGNGAYVGVLQDSVDRYQLKLTSGTVTLRVEKPSREYEIDTPAMAFTTHDAGEYRIDVNDKTGDSDITVREGRGTANVDQRGEETLEAPTRYKVLSGGQSSRADAANRDSWDNWNGERENLQAHSESQKHVPGGVYGYESLDRNGGWVPSEYGMAWVPAGVAADWQPYQSGRWAWMDPFGWTWVSYEPWGWAPYHYGRWAFIPGAGWAWVPGAERQVFAPALVAYVPGDEWFGWFPLGPGEAYSPVYVTEVVYPTVYRNYQYVTVINRTEIYSVHRNYAYRRDVDHRMLEHTRIGHGWGAPRREALYVHSEKPFVGRPPEHLHQREVFARNHEIPAVRKFSEKAGEYNKGGTVHGVSPVATVSGHPPMGIKTIASPKGTGSAGDSTRTGVPKTFSVPAQSKNDATRGVASVKPEGRTWKVPSADSGKSASTASGGKPYAPPPAGAGGRSPAGTGPGTWTVPKQTTASGGSAPYKPATTPGAYKPPATPSGYHPPSTSAGYKPPQTGSAPSQAGSGQQSVYRQPPQQQQQQRQAPPQQQQARQAAPQQQQQRQAPPPKQDKKKN
jgi:hypothetical protein